MIYLILILALILRLINLNQSLWLDEAVQAVTAKESFSYIFAEIRGDFHPPLYYFLMHFWVRIFGDSEIALRMPSVLFGVGTVYFLYKIAMHMHSKNHAILAGFLMATAPFHIYYSQEARMYSMACFFATLSMYFFVKINKLTRSRINGLFLLYLLFTVLLLYSDYYGFLVLLAQMIYLTIKKKNKFIIYNLKFIILCYFPWIPMLITQMKTGMLATQALPGWGRLVNVSFWKAIPLTLVKFTIGRITIFDKRVYVVFSAGLLVFLGAILANLIKSNIKEKNNKYILLFSLWFIAPLIISWIASLVIPNFQPFRLLLILPAFYLLIAFGVSQVSTSMIRIIEGGIIVVISLISLSVYFSNPYFHREDWRGVTAYLLRQDSSLVLLPSSTSNWPIRYYDQQNKLQLIYGSEGTSVINGLAKLWIDDGTKNVFYIRYLTSLFDPQELILAKLQDGGYTKTREISFNQIPVWEYQLVTGD